MTNQIKIATCGWGAPFEEFCEIAARTGYAGIETGIDAYAGREAELRALLDRHGLSIAAASAGGLFLDPATRAQDIAAVEETARRLSAFGIHTLEMHTGARPVGGPTDEQIDCYAGGLNEVGRRCQALGVSIGVHNHCIQFIETEREIDALYSRLDPALVGLGFDTGHLALAGCDSTAIFKRYIERGFRVNYVHLKDLYQVSKPAGESERVMVFGEVLALAVASDIFTWLVIRDVDGRRIVLGGGPLGHEFLRGHRGLIRGVRCCDITEYQFAEIGQGTLDFPALFEVLRTANYDGWISVELDVAYRPRPESAKLSRDYIREVLKA
jgi:inosose dehydratase